MANTLTLTDIAAEIYAARDIVAREAAGAVTSVIVNSSEVTRAAYGETVKSHKTAKPTLNTSITPSMTIPSGDDQTVGSDTMTLNKTVNVTIPMTGENVRTLENGVGYEAVVRDMFAQALRVCVNAIESYVCSVIHKAASRAIGTAGTTPFASDFDLIADVRKVLFDNATPFDGRTSLILDSAAGTKLRQLAQLQKVNESGDSNLLRRGELLNLQGFSLKESAGIARHTAGTGTGDTLSGTPAIGATELTLSAFADGEYVAGDVIVIEDDPNQYVITSADDATEKVTIGQPGLLVTGVNGKTITRAANHTANIAFHQLAVELAIRPPLTPYGGDAAVDAMVIGDPATGLVFEVAEYRGYKMNMFDITAYYGVKVWKPEFVAKLLG
jgi:hypothetical protein